MTFHRLAATTDELMITECAQKETVLVYHDQIVSIVEKYNIPNSMIVNLDQTPSKHVQSLRHTMVEKSMANVEIFASSDK